MASKSGKGYTVRDIDLLIERARNYCFVDDLPSTENASWMLEGGMGSPRWVTTNSGKEYFDKKWRDTRNVIFDIQLPDMSNLFDEVNRPCFDSLQKWSFALRTGWLGCDHSPKYWQATTRWGLILVSWMYLRKDEFFPQEHGFGLLKEEDLRVLFEELSVDGWAYALRVIKRSFIALYELAYGECPPESMLAELPCVSQGVVRDIVYTLESQALFVKNNSRDQRVICRKFLSSRLGCSCGMFNALSVRKFLRGFEFEGVEPKILVPGHTGSILAPSHSKYSMERIIVPPTKGAMLLHATYCASFVAGHKIASIGIPNTGYSHDSIRELKGRWARSEHRELIPFNAAFAVLNEAACWITQYGDDLLSLYEKCLNSRLELQVLSEGRSKEYLQKRTGRAYSQMRAEALGREQVHNREFGVVTRLGLSVALNGNGRSLVRDDLSLGQAMFALVGACAYAIGMMKPLRDDELATIPFDCVLRNNKTNGCFAEFPIEKSAPQGMKRYVKRPIPYFTYLAIRLMQRLGRITAAAYDNGDNPPRLFYFPSGLGFDEAPLKSHIPLSINRCMDIFCDYVGFVGEDDGTRKYFRVHELRKFFLLMLSWDDPEHGLECGAWMAGHRNKDYIQAYTDSNASGVEVTAWTAEQVEVKLLQMESSGMPGNPSDDLSKLYADLKRDLRVSSISGAAKPKFDSYVKNALAAGRYTVRLMTLTTADGDQAFDFGVFIKEVDRG